MKKVNSIFVFVFLSFTLFATPLNWKNQACLYDHLVEVNKEWLKISPNELLCETIVFENDTERIQAHLRLVEQYLRQHPSRGLDKEQMNNRATALDFLSDYWKSGNFPKNTFHQKRQPYFVDHFGTACAVGHLAVKTGAGDLVNQISKENNFAYVSALKVQYPTLLDWAAENGFTAEELAWIQPGYPPANQTWNIVGNGGGFDGEIHVMKAFADEMLYFAGEFSAVDGVAANSIIAWDGNDWHTLGGGVTGIIHDINISNFGNVYIVGDFYVNGQPEIENVAQWKDGLWTGYETSNMAGAVYAVHSIDSKLYIGGDFEFISTSGDTVRNLAYVESGQAIFGNNDGLFSVNGPVYDFENYNNEELLVAGDFTQTAIYTNDPEANQLETKHLASWTHQSVNNWTTGFDHLLDPLNSVKVIESTIYVGPKNTEEFIGLFEMGQWNYGSSIIKLDENQSSFVHGILSFNELVIYFGNIYLYPLVGTWSRGIYVLNGSPSLMSEGASFDAPVTAAAVFQNQIYFAGDFTNVQGQEFPGLVSTPFDALTATGEIFVNDKVTVFASNSQITVQHEMISDDLTFLVYNLSGQLVKEIALPNGTGETSISTQNWAAGMYVYQLVGEDVQQSGKLAVF